MKKKQFEQQFPDIAARFSQNFWNDAPPEHPIKYNISRDNSKFFSYLSKLTSQTPVDEIVSQYQNNLFNISKFRAFESEMVGYVATDRWLCSNPTVLHIQGTSGLPEFECTDFDVEVARVLESTEVDQIRAWLEDEFGGGCKAIVEKKSKYNNYASGNPDWKQNEKQVRKVLNKLDGHDKSDIPFTINTNALCVKVVQSNAKDVGYFGTSSPSIIIPDEDDDIPRKLRSKASKCRNNRPLIVFLDLSDQTVDCVREVIDKTIGKTFGFGLKSDVQQSQHIKNVDTALDDYLEQIGVVPDGGTGSYPAIKPDDEGVFSENNVSCIAGVLFRLYHGEVGYIPNIYMNDVDAKKIYDSLDWGLDTQSLEASDI